MMAMMAMMKAKIAHAYIVEDAAEPVVIRRLSHAAQDR
jgi:hypothetical protein